MAKMSLTAYMNQELKIKGIGVKEAKKNAGKYKSISAAKKAGSLYYTDKKGNVMAAVFAEDLNKKPKVTAAKPNIKVTVLKPGQKGDLLSDRHMGTPGPYDERKYKKFNSTPKALATTTNKRRDSETKMSQDNILDKLTAAQQQLVRNRIKDGMSRSNAIAKTYADSILDKKQQVVSPGVAATGNSSTAANKRNKGGMVMKKKTGYAKGGMPMVMKNGKKVPAFAADGVGKMNMGGMAAKKKPAAKMMAGGMAKKKPTAKMMAGGMAAKKKPAAKMMGGGMTKSSGYMYGGMAKKKPAAKRK